MFLICFITVKGPQVPPLPDHVIIFNTYHKKRRRQYLKAYLSFNIVSGKITDLADNVQKQLFQIAKGFETLSITLDESTDSCDKVHCAVSCRGAI